MTPDERLAEIEADLPHVHRPDGVWLVGQLRDARAENERLQALLDQDIITVDDHLARIRPVEAELAAERAKVQRAEAVADEWDHREYVRMPEDFAATLRGALTDECDS